MKAFFAAVLFMTTIFVVFSREIPGAFAVLGASDQPRIELPKTLNSSRKGWA